MQQSAIQYGAVAGFALAGVAYASWLKIGLAREVAIVCARAVIQLLIVGALLGLVFRYRLLGIPFLMVMLTTATTVAARRLRPLPGRIATAAAGVVTPAIGALAILLATQAFAFEPRAAIPAAGILIGGAMSAVGLAGRQFVAGLTEREGEIETRLCLGDRVQVALRPLVDDATRISLIPILDQTRAVGLVTLPGTFIGLVLGGASPGEAARLQLLVLVALVTVELVAARLVTGLAARACTVAGERIREI